MSDHVPGVVDDDPPLFGNGGRREVPRTIRDDEASYRRPLFGALFMFFALGFGVAGFLTLRAAVRRSAAFMADRYHTIPAPLELIAAMLIGYLGIYLFLGVFGARDKLRFQVAWLAMAALSFETAEMYFRGDGGLHPLYYDLFSTNTYLRSPAANYEVWRLTGGGIALIVGILSVGFYAWQWRRVSLGKLLFRLALTLAFFGFIIHHNWPALKVWGYVFFHWVYVLFH